MGDDMGGLKHGGPLMGYRDGGWPPWKKSVLPYPDLPYEGIGSSAPRVSRPSSLWKHAKRGGLPILLAMELMFPEKAGSDEELKQMRKDAAYQKMMRKYAAYQKMMDERHGEGWSYGPEPEIPFARTIIPRIETSKVRKLR